MTISAQIRGEMFTLDKNLYDFTKAPPGQLFRLPMNQPQQNVECNKTKTAMETTAMTEYDKVKAEPVIVPKTREKPQRYGMAWTTDEHDRFLQGMELFPSGPWKSVASYVGTRTPRQTMAHAQKYRQKIQRQERKLFMKSLAQPVPMTPVAYDGFVVATNVKDQALHQLPKAVNRPLDVNEQAASLQSNEDDKAELGELSPAFQAFCELYGYAVFPMGDEKQINTVTCDFLKTETTMFVDQLAVKP